jgi:inhibitor of KinA
MSKKLNRDFKIFCLGDSAATIDLGNSINETLNLKIIAMQQWLSLHAFDGMKDLVVAYGSLSVIYDTLIVKKKYAGSSTAFEFVKLKLEEAWEQSVVKENFDKDAIKIPVCYDDNFAPDINFLSSENKLTKEEIIQIHISKTYRVYMIGFLPGFSYMGEVDERLIIPRKNEPIPVVAGSVGIAGSQTGIYPVNSPGGWQIIGRTPVKLFDAFSEPHVKISIGDHVQFYQITKNEFDGK